MGTARSRTPVPPVEPTDDVAPLVEVSASLAQPALPVEVEAALPTRFVVAFHEGLDTHAVMARTALEDWDGWVAVEDVPDSEPPLLPARFTPTAD